MPNEIVESLYRFQKRASGPPAKADSNCHKIDIVRKNLAIFIMGFGDANVAPVRIGLLIL